MMSAAALTALFKVVDVALTVGVYAAEDKARLQRSANLLKTILGENREPRVDEWEVINKASDDMLAELDARVADAQKGDPAQPS